MSNDQDDEIYVRLLVTSTKRTAEELTSLIGLQCDRSWSIGDKRGKSQILERCNGWELRSHLDSKQSLDSHILSLLDRLKPYEQGVREAAKSDKAVFSCVIYDDEGRPALYFDNQLVRRIASLGVDFDIDVY